MNGFPPPNSNKPYWISHIGIFAGLLGIALVGTYAGFGKTMLEKLVTELLMPAGMIWLGLIAIVYAALVCRQRATGIIALLCLVYATVAGNSFVSNALIQSLEQPYLDVELPRPGDVDTVVLLGGSTETNLHGAAQLNASGDRLAAAARFYHASAKSGFNPQIICTGKQVYRWDETDLDPCDESKNCLIALGVPQANIITMSGANTSQEMQYLKEWIAQQPRPPQVGIMTSAWHLPRAMRLAKSRGIEALPMPGDFKSILMPPQVNMVVPSSFCMQISSLAIKEYLAGMVGR